jgi:hypothetical protein
MTISAGRLLTGGVLLGGAAGAYLGLLTGAVPVDLGVARRTRSLGPLEEWVAAPREVVFDVIEQPYLPRTTRAMQAKVRVLERGTDMVLAAHYTPVRGPLVATTVETVRFTRPERVDFRLVRGPVPYVVETFELTDGDGTTRLAYSGEMGTDLGWLGERWGVVVARSWERTVADSMASVKQEAERRHHD